MLGRLPDGFHALIIGASGGVGGAVLDALLASPRPGRITAMSRSEVARDDARLTCLRLDATREDDRQRLAETLAGEPLHLMFNAIGLLHDATAGIVPEKRLADLDAASLGRLFEVNAITPILLLQALEEVLAGRHPALVASLSARVGSIGDNRLGGWYAYRSSKAAHNMLMKTAAIELARRNKHASLVCLHPGTTDTALSAPFQARVPTHKLFSPAFVAGRLLAVLDAVPEGQSGLFLDWAGDPVPW